MSAGKHGELYSVMTPYVARDGFPDLSVRSQDMDLIAAAPLLLKALTRTHAAMIEHPGGDCRSREDIELACQAILAAYGEHLDYDEMQQVVGTNGSEL